MCQGKIASGSERCCLEICTPLLSLNVILYSVCGDLVTRHRHPLRDEMGRLFRGTIWNGFERFRILEIIRAVGHGHSHWRPLYLRHKQVPSPNGNIGSIQHVAQSGQVRNEGLIQDVVGERY